MYIIKSEKDNKNYIGSTYNIEKRLKWHNEGKSKSTKSRRPFKLIYWREFESKKFALEFERWLKKQKGGVKIKKLLENT
ncbi:MAG: GIY-YIG nuclease family protein [Patescibacteria group bacterium]